MGRIHKYLFIKHTKNGEKYPYGGESTAIYLTNVQKKRGKISLWGEFTNIYLSNTQKNGEKYPYGGEFTNIGSAFE